MKSTSNLLNSIYFATAIVAALGVTLLPLLPPFATLNTSDLEGIQNTFIKITLSAF